MQKTNKPVLTIGMIVKNEIRCIERCMKSLLPLREALPCELIIADTGSNDGTRAVVERYADLCFDFEWINDFAAARNAVLDKATGEWFFTVDADEYLDGDFSELTDFLLHPTFARQYTVGAVVQRNYQTKDLEYGPYGDFLAQRMFRRLPGVRYEGAIHEMPTTKKFNCYVMRHVVLHHDGYIDLDSKQGKLKRKRNMDLLKEKLEKDPHNLLTLLQCIESSGYPDDLGYIRQALKEVEDKQDFWNLIGPIVYRHAAFSYKTHKLPEFWDLVQQAEEKFPNSMVVRSEVNFAAIGVCLEKENWKEAIRRGEAYLQAVADYRNDNFDRSELLHTTFTVISPPFERLMRIKLVNAYYKEKDYAAALAMARTLDASQLYDQQLEDLLHSLLNLHTRSDLDLTAAIETYWAQLSSPVPDEKRARQRRELVTTKAAKAFLSSFYRAEAESGLPRLSYTLFLPLRETCDLGIAAALLESGSLAETDALLSAVSDWSAFPAGALAHALDQGAAFPIPGKPLPLEVLDSLAARLADTGKNYLQEICVCMPMPAAGDLSDWNWARALFLTAVQSCDWKTCDLSLPLARRFAEFEGAFLPHFYTQQTLEKEGLLFLPPVHRFGAYLIRAFDALDAGDQVGYIRFVRSALAANESMKSMAEFLCQLVKPAVSQPSAELLTLAQQVKSLLSSFPEGSPMIESIKAGSAYHQVASLLENDAEEETGPSLL